MRSANLAWAVVGCALALGAAAGSFAQDAVPGRPESVRARKARKVAAAWVNALLAGDVAGTMENSTTPFAWDQGKMVDARDDLKARYGDVVEDKGKRTLTVDATRVEKDVHEVEDPCVPRDFLIVVCVVKGEEIRVCIRPGDPYLVVGFRD